MKFCFPIFGVLLVAFSSAHFANAVKRGSIIPLYIYPKTSNGSDAWKPLKDAFKQNPIEAWAIINVYNGPGTAKDSTYATAMNDLKRIGVKTLGYVSTNYSRRGASDVRTDVNNWKKWYCPQGIFFDEMASDDNESIINYYANLTAYAKSNGFTFTVGNPGTAVPLGYFRAVDTVMIYESGSYPNEDAICSSNYATVPKRKLGIFPYNIQSLDQAAILKAKECTGFLYYTDDKLDNPWDTLPPYLSNLFELLRRQ